MLRPEPGLLNFRMTWHKIFFSFFVERFKNKFSEKFSNLDRSGHRLTKGPEPIQKGCVLYISTSVWGAALCTG